jgi:Galactose mutarotase and related enzymes
MRIAAGDWRLEVDPDNGGMVRSLTRRGRDILRPMPAGSTEPFESACFPLAPYVNRIAHGRFTWDGADYHLAPNHEGQAHPLHGTAWLGAWHTEALGPDSLVQVHRHEAGPDWAWSFTLRQTLRLTPKGLEARLDLENTDARAMPAGLGFHPWLCRKPVSSIAFSAEAMWLGDADMLPTQLAPADALGDWRRGAGLERGDLIDHCYTGWNGTLRIARSDGDILLESEDAPWLHLYLPPGKDFFCAEPQTTMPDAVNIAPPAPLASGEAASLTMQIVSG